MTRRVTVTPCVMSFALLAVLGVLGQERDPFTAFTSRPFHPPLTSISRRARTQPRRGVR